jgi:hypothetical protein
MLAPAPAANSAWTLPDARRQWHVTAPYLAPRSHEREPWGTHHVKLEGSLVAACGEPAVDWHVFWGRGFDTEATGACARCARVWTLARTLAG